MIVNEIWFPRKIIIKKKNPGNKIELHVVCIKHIHGLEVPLEESNKERKLQKMHRGWKKNTVQCGARVNSFCHFGSNFETNELALPESILRVCWKLGWTWKKERREGRKDGKKKGRKKGRKGREERKVSSQFETGKEQVIIASKYYSYGPENVIPYSLDFILHFCIYGHFKLNHDKG